jgi:hypothetical protein
MLCLLTRYQKWALLWLRWSYFISLHSFSVTSILILSYQMCLFQMGFVLQFSYCSLYIFLISPSLSRAWTIHLWFCHNVSFYWTYISSKAVRLLFFYVDSVWISVSKKTKHLQMLTSRWCSSLLKVFQRPEGFFSEMCLPLQRGCLCSLLTYIIHLILYSVFLHYQHNRPCTW